MIEHRPIIVTTGDKPDAGQEAVKQLAAQMSPSGAGLAAIGARYTRCAFAGAKWEHYRMKAPSRFSRKLHSSETAAGEASQ